MTYHYNKDANGNLIQNRLYHVNDNATPLASGEDITDQGAFVSNASQINTKNNYNYDEIGNLRKDSSEGIANIEWTVYGKVKSITRRNGFSKTVNGVLIYPSDLEFLYDPTGNRIAKIEMTRDANGLKSASEWKTTYYTRDAQGNEMATYKMHPITINGSPATSFILTEQPLYGSRRIGSTIDSLELLSALPQTNIFTHGLGLKQFEGDNHLSNCLSTVSDRKIQHPNSTDTIVGYYTADIRSSQDYEPFGMLMPKRSFSSNKYRFGFNGKEKDDEMSGVTGADYNYGFRIYDARIGRFLSVDPLFKGYPWYSPYQFAGNMPIIAIDIDGKEEFIIINWYDSNNKYIGKSVIYKENINDRIIKKVGDCLIISMQKNEENKLMETIILNNNLNTSIDFNKRFISTNTEGKKEFINSNYFEEGGITNKKIINDTKKLKEAYIACEKSKPTNGCPVEETVTPYVQDVLFSNASSELSEDAKSKLDVVASRMNFDSDAKADLTGMTSLSGTKESNQKLSENRVKAVADYLKSKGVSEDRIITHAVGETKPVNTSDTKNTDPNSKAASDNRRVVVTLVQ